MVMGLNEVMYLLNTVLWHCTLFMLKALPMWTENISHFYYYSTLLAINHLILNEGVCPIFGLAVFISGDWYLFSFVCFLSKFLYIIFQIILSRKRFVHVKNPYLDSMDEDILYHLDLGTKTHDLPAMFGDVKVKVFLTFGKIIVFFSADISYFTNINFTCSTREMSEVLIGTKNKCSFSETI